MKDEKIEFVKTGYTRAAKIYRDQKDDSQIKLPIFLEWLGHPKNNGKILEIGCGSGYPIAKKILDSDRDYLGIDLSQEQIDLAIKQFPHWKDRFENKEMLEFCRQAPSNTYSGVISLFSIRHLPRIYHVDLFTQIYRIMTENGLFLIDVPHYSGDEKGTWFGDMPMYWSSFSPEWTELTLKEIGFNLLNSYDEVKIFNNEEEHTKYLLLQKYNWKDEKEKI